MPGMDGLEATRIITTDAALHSAVLVLTTFNREDYLFTALRAGASGFLLKNSTPEDLIEAVQVIARGEALLSPAVTRRVIAAFGSVGASAQLPDPEQTRRRRRLGCRHHRLRLQPPRSPTASRRC